MIQENEHYLIALDTIRNKFANHKGIIVDVGAFDGDSTVCLARGLKQNIVYAFEPNPIPYHKAQINVSSLSNVKLYNFGFADRTGEMDLHVTTNYVSSSLFAVKDFTETSPKEIIRVNVDTLDNFFHSYQDILLLKMDVQGAELSILKHGVQTLRKTKLVLTEMLITELYHGSCFYYEVDSFLESQNFKLFSIIANYNNTGLKYYDALYINKGC
jgi:FkbM family methyltransferase